MTVPAIHPVDALLLLGAIVALAWSFIGWWRASLRLNEALTRRLRPGLGRDPHPWEELLPAMFLQPVAPAIVAVALIVAWVGTR